MVVAQVLAHVLPRAPSLMSRLRLHMFGFFGNCLPPFCDLTRLKCDLTLSDLLLNVCTKFTNFSEDSI